MKVIDDGVIKYDRSNFSLSGPIPEEEYKQLEYWRKKLYNVNLIGEYKDQGVGFGNMSMVKNYQHIKESNVPQFIITGTQTGKFPDLTGSHYTRVTDYEISKLKIFMMGSIEASSEALTHAAIYETNSNIKVIFHIHSNFIWTGMIEDQADFTHESIPYGTVEMARATQKCVGHKNVGSFCMKGHEDGVVIYGTNLDEVGELTLKLYQRYLK
jgi:ribulose-5-phosphate 4-epimerase/fuculose-1-phosphate aldolase